MPIEPPAADGPTAQRASGDPLPTLVSSQRERRVQFTPGHILGSRYRIVSLIGQGGMGDVYRADDLKIGHTVALKFLLHHGHARRLYEEVRVGREISHPNVCRLYDAVEVEDQLFITMEFIDGEDLASLLRRVGRLPPEKGLAVARDICAGVSAAHEKGVIHRDLKPANVMIDGRGRALVTDFGLAAAAGGEMDRSGTTAYMAPEQLAGAAASVASDVYAVGLVLYEIFTGQRAFQASTVDDLLRLQRAADFPRPATLTADIPAEVESVIIRCLDPEARARPASLAEILRSLPGGDPLAAALAAGETPTPGMVAAASRTGDLPGWVAWTMLTLAAGGMLAAATVSQRTILARASAMKAPDVLRERAREILREAGVSQRPADSDLMIQLEPHAGRLAAVYRQSLRPMYPRNPNGRIFTFDPPLDRGMANVHLDGEGSLLRFIIARGLFDQPVPGELKWDPFLRAAGYDPLSLTQTSPRWPAAIIQPGRSNSAFIDSDRKAAWLTRDGNRIEAASFRGRPVFFSVITPEVARVATAVPQGVPAYLPERLAFGMAVAFLIAIPIAALALARVNLRRGQGDRTGAFRTGGFFFVAALTGLVFRAHHPMRFLDEWRILSWHVAQATFWALMTGLIYIAVEPFVRKRWPQILISWARLLAGRYRDPMVGRDVLLGAAGAGAAILVWQATHVVSGQEAFFTTPATLGPARFVLSMVASTLAEAVLRAFGLVILLVVIRAVLPSDVGASVLCVLLLAISLLADTYGPPWLRAGYAIAASVLGVFLARNLGLLAVMSYASFLLLQQRLPLTLDAETWFFGRSAVVMVSLLVVMACAFRISVGSKRWLPRIAVD